MKVVAIRQGYVGDKRRNEGEVFELPEGVPFSKSWMASADGSEAPPESTKPARVQNPQDPRDLNAVVNKQLGDKAVLNNGAGIKPLAGGMPPARRGRPAKAQASEAPAEQGADAQPAKQGMAAKAVSAVKHAIGGDDHSGDGSSKKVI